MPGSLAEQQQACSAHWAPPQLAPLSPRWRPQGPQVSPGARTVEVGSSRARHGQERRAQAWWARVPGCPDRVAQSRQLEMPERVLSGPAGEKPWIQASGSPESVPGDPHLPRVLAVSPVPGFQKRPHHSAVMVTGVLLCVCIHAPLLSLNLSCWIRGPLTPGLIQRWLPLGRKAMTSLDSILKSRDITLPTKFCIVKPMVFPGVMYGCESWIIKKAEC